ncbi:phage major capsid protein [Gordonia paraffinivorans]|uniref:phage major capsid protein n=1 Tax=Gordonia paraffinivorans TaxID=175628 RepID=UPI0014477A37|nr:phage major capsid protein [Gordonia paraffinivorans]
MAFTATTSNSDAAWRPDVSVFAPVDTVPEAVLLQASTVSGEIIGDAPSLRVGYVTDDDAAVTPEGQEIDESEPTLDEVVVKTSKITQLVRISNEQWRQQGTSDQLAQSVRRALIKKSDILFLSDPDSGIAERDDIVDGGAVDGDLDGLINLETEIREAGGDPRLWILSPRAWALIRQIKTSTDSNVALLGAGVEDMTPRILSLEVVVNPALEPGDGLLVDPSAIVSAVSQIEVATSDQQYFSSDSVALRAIWRVGHEIVRPDRVGRFTIGSAS